jgi:hypothetical protein
LIKNSIDTCKIIIKSIVIYGAWNTLASECRRLMPTTISSYSRPQYSKNCLQRAIISKEWAMENCYTNQIIETWSGKK